MEAPLPIVLASPQKRPHADDVEPSITTPNRSAPSNASTPLTVISSLDTPSPVKMKQCTESTPPKSNTSVAGDGNTSTQTAPATASTQQAVKRRKLTQQEKEEQAKEKEVKAQARAEKKAQEDKLKAEQKAQKDEEKRARDEEKRKKNEEKEEKKRAKELKQQQEEEEKRKKERSQMRLNAFFTKPKAVAEPVINTTVEPSQRPSIGQSSLSTDTVVTIANAAPPSPQKDIVKNAQSDYERAFLPFSLPPTAVLAPSNALLANPDDLEAAQSRLDDILAHKDDDSMEIETHDIIRSYFPQRRRGLETTTITEIVDRVNGSADNPIDLTDIQKEKPLDLLRQIPMKYLHFGEDVRPPYFGTYTKVHDPAQERKVARNPVHRGLDDLSYDYDSEAEWEEPGEGEDLDSEGEEDLEDDGDEDLDGFLDDDDDPEVKRRLLNGDQEPISTGLCWEDTSGVSRLNDGSGAISTEFKDFRMGFLLQTQEPVDPFSEAYWNPEPPVSRSNIQTFIKGSQSSGAMEPPRLPLASRPVNGLLNTLNGSPKAPSGVDTKTGKPKRTVPTNLLPEFKATVEGSDLTKIGMIEALKKKFPKVPKDALTNTLTEVAQRIGPSASEKRWVLFT